MPDSDIMLLIQRMDEFEKKYPEYADLMPIRESIYKLNRLEGLQESIRLQQRELGAITNRELKEHLASLAYKSTGAADKIMGLAVNNSAMKLFSGTAWSGGADFSQRIWQNTDKLADYLNNDIANGFARGDSYERLVGQVRSRFINVAKNDAYRLIYTEGTYVMNESSAAVFAEDFEDYEFQVADNNACPVCKALNGKIFKFSQRVPGRNFPPMHPWCRCHYGVAVADWDAWQDEYVKKHGGKSGEKILNNVIDRNKLSSDNTPSGFVPPKFWELKSGDSNMLSDLKNSNPHFNESKAYQINCQKCVPTYEMRRRGYDVEAFPTYSNADIVKNRWDKVFKNPQIQHTKGDPKSEITKALLDYGNGARMQVYVEFLDDDYSHTFVAENVEGNIYFLDPQTSQNAGHYFIHNLIKVGKTKYFRIDNLEPTELIKQCCKGKR